MIPSTPHIGLNSDLEQPQPLLHALSKEKDFLENVKFRDHVYIHTVRIIFPNVCTLRGKRDLRAFTYPKFQRDHLSTNFFTRLSRLSEFPNETESPAG